MAVPSLILLPSHLVAFTQCSLIISSMENIMHWTLTSLLGIPASYIVVILV
uniref:Uncharacterized protein n=1 Tax=Arundo donax TaxID=35708 RepID=A0A0A9BKX7_ARUDO